MLEWHEYLKMLVGLFAIVNPLLAVPEFMTLTRDDSQQRRHHIALRTSLAVALVIAVSALGGQYILSAFGITIASFQVGGGILILLMAISMLHARMSEARHSHDEAKDAQDRNDIAVVPLAIPLLAGPGTITSVIIYAHQSSSISHHVVLIALGMVVALAIWLSLRVSEPIVRVIGNTGIKIASRIMGLILAAIAVEFITHGLATLLPGLAH